MSNDDSRASPADEALLGRLAEDYLHDLWLGKAPSIDEIAARHPTVAELVHEVFPTLRTAADLEGHRPSLRLNCPVATCENGILIRDPFNESAGTYLCTACEKRYQIDGIRPSPSELATRGVELPVLAELESALGRYKIKGGKLGEGGFASVWLAESRDGWVAIKVPHTRPTADQWKRYVSEVEVNSKLPPHANIVAIRDYGKHNDVYFIVLDYKDAAPLSYANRRSTGEALALMRRIVAAVTHLHENGVAHRDLSPKNILIDRSDGVTPYLVDFGLAKQFDDDGRYERELTTVGQIVGNQRYMSPEQRLGMEGHDLRRSDVFSLGVILHELLTGDYPFEGDDSAEQVANKNARDTRLNGAPSIHKISDSNLRMIVARCIDRSPAKRPADARALASLLDGTTMLNRRRLTATVTIAIAVLAVLVLLGIRGLGDRNRVELEVTEFQGKPRLYLNGNDTQWESLTALLSAAAPDVRLDDASAINISNAKLALTDTDFESAKNLVVIELTGCDIDLRLQAKIPSVEYVSVNACSGIQAMDVSVFPESEYISLTRLPDLIELTGFEDTRVIAVALDRLPQLKTLRGIRGHPRICDLQISHPMQLESTITSHLESLKKLRTLTLSFVDIATLNSILASKDLQSLAISDARNLVSIEAIASLPRMRKLCIARSPSVDWYSLGPHPQLDLFGDSWSEKNVEKIYGEPIAAENDYWIWRDQMLQQNIKADRYFDVFLETE